MLLARLVGVGLLVLLGFKEALLHLLLDIGQSSSKICSSWILRNV